MTKPIEKKKQNYLEYVQKKLKKYRVDSPDKVPNKFKKKFFTELDKGWESKKEKKDKKEKKKAEIVTAVKDILKRKSDEQIAIQANLEGFSKDWEKTLGRITKSIVSNLASNNAGAVGVQLRLLKQSCEDLELLLEDESKPINASLSSFIKSGEKYQEKISSRLGIVHELEKQIFRINDAHDNHIIAQEEAWRVKSKIKEALK